MARSLIPDPLALFREAINRFETGANSLVNRKIADSRELAKALNNVATVSLGAQRVMDKALAGFFARLDIPSRAEVAALSTAVQRIEDKLDLLLPASARTSVVPRPARTRRPPPIVQAAPAVVVEARKATKPAARRARKGAAR